MHKRVQLFMPTKEVTSGLLVVDSANLSRSEDKCMEQVFCACDLSVPEGVLTA